MRNLEFLAEKCVNSIDVYIFFTRSFSQELLRNENLTAQS